jgi:hypothetical protein
MVDPAYHRVSVQASGVSQGTSPTGLQMRWQRVLYCCDHAEMRHVVAFTSVGYQLPIQAVPDIRRRHRETALYQRAELTMHGSMPNVDLAVYQIHQAR